MSNLLQEAHETHWRDKQADNHDNFFRNLLVKEIITKAPRNAKILDLACGNGDITEYLTKFGFTNVCSVDFSLEGTEMTKSRGGKNVLLADICEKLPYTDASFDYVFWLDNIEHLYSPQSAMDNIKRIIKKDGQLVLSLPNMGYWFYRLYYLKNGIVVGTDGVLPDGHINMPWEFQHIRFFNEKMIRKFLSINGFKKIEIKPYHNGSKIKNFISNIYPRLLADGFLISANQT